MKKKIIIAVLIIISASAWAFYLYNKPHKNVSDIKPAISISAEDLLSQYENDEASSNKIFLDKVIEVKGIVLETVHTDSTASVQLDGGRQPSGVNCSFIFSKDQQIKFPLKHSTVNIKGRCTGFLADVNLVDCVIE